MEKPANIADLEQLEDEVDQALIDVINKSSGSVTFADLRRRQSYLRNEIEWLRHEASN
ncbi:MAG TPA: hypothetical protein VEC94_04890 [Pseudolabrys sp.]|nr:hypothetical protein [Pseudolabrys sp.]